MTSLRRPSLLASLVSNTSSTTSSSTSASSTNTSASSSNKKNKKSRSSSSTSLSVSFSPSVQVQLFEDLHSMRPDELWYTPAEREGFQSSLVKELKIIHRLARQNNNRQLQQKKKEKQEESKETTTSPTSSSSSSFPVILPQGHNPQSQLQPQPQLQLHEEEQEEVTLRGIEHYRSSQSLQRQKQEQHNVVWAVLRCQDQQRRLIAHQLSAFHRDDCVLKSKELLESAIAAARRRMEHEIRDTSCNLSMASRQRAVELGGQDEIDVFGHRRLRLPTSTEAAASSSRSSSPTSAMEVDTEMEASASCSSSSTSQDFNSTKTSTSATVTTVEDDDNNTNKMLDKAVHSPPPHQGRGRRPNRSSLTDDQHRHTSHYMAVTSCGPTTSPYFASTTTTTAATSPTNMSRKSSTFRPTVQLEEPRTQQYTELPRPSRRRMRSPSPSP